MREERVNWSTENLDLATARDRVHAAQALVYAAMWSRAVKGSRPFSLEERKKLVKMLCREPARAQELFTLPQHPC